MKERFEQWLTTIVQKGIESIIDTKLNSIDTKVGSTIKQEIEALRHEYLPHGACWFCSNPVSRGSGYRMWQGKMFCTENCLTKFHGLIQHPDNNYVHLDGEPILVFKAKI